MKCAKTFAHSFRKGRTFSERTGKTWMLYVAITFTLSLPFIHFPFHATVSPARKRLLPPSPAYRRQEGVCPQRIEAPFLIYILQHWTLCHTLDLVSEEWRFWAGLIISTMARFVHACCQSAFTAQDDSQTMPAALQTRKKQSNKWSPFSIVFAASFAHFPTSM